MELRKRQACALAHIFSEYTDLDLGGVEGHNPCNYSDCKLSVRFPAGLQS